MKTKKLRWIIFISLVGIVSVYFSIPFLNDNLRSLNIESLTDVTDYGSTGNKIPDKVMFYIEFNKNLGELGPNDVEIDINFDKKAEILSIKKTKETRVRSAYIIEVSRSELINNTVSITKVKHGNKEEVIQENNLIEFKVDEIIKKIEYEFSEKIYTDSDEVELNLILESKFKVDVSKILLKNNLDIVPSRSDLEMEEYEYVEKVTFINRKQNVSKYTFKIKLDKTKARIINLEEIYFNYERETPGSTVVIASKRTLDDNEKLLISSEFKETYVLNVPERIAVYSFEKNIILPVELKNNKKLGEVIYLDYTVKKVNGENKSNTFKINFLEKLNFNIILENTSYEDVESIAFDSLKYGEGEEAITYDLEGYEIEIENTECNIFKELSVNENKYYINQETYAAVFDLPSNYSFKKIMVKVGSTEFELQFRFDGDLLILRDNLTSEEFKDMNGKDIKVSRVILIDHRENSELIIEENFFENIVFGKMNYIDLKVDVQFKVDENINVLDENSNNLILYGESSELSMNIKSDIYDNEENSSWNEDLILTYVNFRFVNKDNIVQKRIRHEVKGDLQNQFEYIADFEGFFGSVEVESLVYTIKGNTLNDKETQYTLNRASKTLSLNVENDKIHYISEENLKKTRFNILKERTAVVYQSVGNEKYQLDLQKGNEKFKFKDDLIKYELKLKFNDDYFKIEYNDEFIDEYQDKRKNNEDHFSTDEEYTLNYKLYVTIDESSYYLKDFNETTIASEEDLSFVNLTEVFNFEYYIGLNEIVLLNFEEDDNTTGTMAFNFDMFKDVLLNEYDTVTIDLRITNHLKKEGDKILKYNISKEGDSWLYKIHIKEEPDTLLVGDEIIFEKITFLNNDGYELENRIIEGFSLSDKSFDITNRTVLANYKLDSESVKHDGKTYLFSYKLTNIAENKSLSPFAEGYVDKLNLKLKKEDVEFHLIDFSYRENLVKDEAVLEFKFKDEMDKMSTDELKKFLDGLNLICSNNLKGG